MFDTFPASLQMSLLVEKVAKLTHTSGPNLQWMQYVLVCMEAFLSAWVIGLRCI